MDRQRALRIVLVIISAILILNVVFLSNFALVVFDFSHYEQQFEELDRVEYTGMEEEELYRVTDEILAYLKLQRSDIDITAEIEGEEVQLFTERELIHMYDVKELFEEGYGILAGSGFLLIVCLYLGAAYLYYSQNFKTRVLAVVYLIKWGTLAALGTLGVLGGIFFIGFDFWYDQLHIWMFDNDYWLLNPRIHNLIRIFPVPFFYNTIVRIVIRTVAHLGIISLISLTANKIRFPKRK